MLLVSALFALALSACAQGRSSHERDGDPPGAYDAGTPRRDAGSGIDGGDFFHDAAPHDAAAVDAAPIDAARDDAFIPDAFGVCVDGTRTPCATACGSTGSMGCVRGSFGSCEAPSETCNGLDDDCDGVPDQSFACALGASGSCTTSCGSTGTRDCTNTCAWGACEAPSETCNGRDDDCDGVVDDGFRATSFTTTYAGTLSAIQPTCNGSSERFGLYCNSAIHRHCENGCTTSGFGPVENAGNAAQITCVIGEDRNITYSTLAGFLSVCNGVSSGNSQHCNAAIHRYCVDAGFTSGFGPVEVNGTNVTVTCVRNATVIRSSYTTLRGFHSPCNGSGERWGPNCNAAIHRYCVDAGYVSGFGPVENDGDTAYVACVSR